MRRKNNNHHHELALIDSVRVDQTISVKLDQRLDAVELKDRIVRMVRSTYALIDDDKDNLSNLR